MYNRLLEAPRLPDPARRLRAFLDVESPPALRQRRGPADSFKGTPITSTANVKVDVYIDSELIGSRIESAVTSALSLLGSSADTDGRAKHMPAQR